MPRHFPPAAYTSALLAITFAALGVWQGLHLAEQQRDAARAWSHARTAAEKLLKELSADASANPAPTGPGLRSSPVVFSTTTLQGALDRAGERLDKALIDARTRQTNAELDNAKQINSDESRRTSCEKDLQTKEKAAQDKMSHHQAKTSDKQSLWTVTYEASRTPAWDPGPEPTIGIPWETMAQLGPLVTGPVVVVPSLGLSVEAIRTAIHHTVWKAGRAFCEEANRLDSEAREAKVALSDAVARLEQTKQRASESLESMQRRIETLAANRRRCQDAMNTLASSASAATVRTVLLGLDVPALMASMVACLLACVRFALVTNAFSGCRIVRRV